MLTVSEKAVARLRSKLRAAQMSAIPRYRGAALVESLILQMDKYPATPAVYRLLAALANYFIEAPEPPPADQYQWLFMATSESSRCSDRRVARVYSGDLWASDGRCMHVLKGGIPSVPDYAQVKLEKGKLTWKLFENAQEAAIAAYHNKLPNSQQREDVVVTETEIIGTRSVPEYLLYVENYDGKEVVIKLDGKRYENLTSYPFDNRVWFVAPRNKSSIDVLFGFESEGAIGMMNGQVIKGK